MRIVVVGATGNVGTSVLEALAADDAVESIVNSLDGEQRPESSANGQLIPGFTLVERESTLGRSGRG